MLSRLRAVRVRFLGFWEFIRQSYGFVPALMAATASLLAAILVVAERTRQSEWVDEVPWLGTLSADSCRSILQAIAGSSITVAGTVFSVMIVALTLASSQFGPRLLRIFLRDRGNQFALGVFVSTFIYSLLVLASVRADHVPRVATTGAVLLAVLSVAVLVFVLHRASTTIQASHLVTAVFEEIEEQVEALRPIEEDSARGAGESNRRALARRELDSLAGESRVLSVESGPSQQGYLRAVQVDDLLDLACREDLVIELTGGPGIYVYPRSLIANVYVFSQSDDSSATPGESGSGEPSDRSPSDSAVGKEDASGPRTGATGRRDDAERAQQNVSELSEEQVEAVSEEVRSCLVLGSQRSAMQDNAFLLEQLVEMAVRALSPGINDPRTAVLCLHRLGGALSLMTDRQIDAPYIHDEEGTLRVWRPTAEFEELCGRAFNPIRLAGIAQPDVMVALFEALHQLAERSRQARGAASSELEAVAELARDSWSHFETATGLSRVDRAAVRAAYEAVLPLIESLALPSADGAADAAEATS